MPPCFAASNCVLATSYRPDNADVIVELHRNRTAQFQLHRLDNSMQNKCSISSSVRSVLQWHLAECSKHKESCVAGTLTWHNLD